jgi:hypothetical protein
MLPTVRSATESGRQRDKPGGSPHNEAGHPWHHPDAQLNDWIIDGKMRLGQMPAFEGKLIWMMVMGLLFQLVFWGAIIFLIVWAVLSFVVRDGEKIMFFQLLAQGQPVVLNFWPPGALLAGKKLPYWPRRTPRIGRRVEFVGIDIWDRPEDAMKYGGRYGVT